jgi:ubiquinone/menaquinone biosynthesis C-methylase UbiE
MVNLTRELVERYSLKAEKITVDSITQIPYEDGFFDQVFYLAVLDHVNDQAREMGILELGRVLKKAVELLSMSKIDKHIIGGLCFILCVFLSFILKVIYIFLRLLRFIKSQGKMGLKK